MPQRQQQINFSVMALGIFKRNSPLDFALLLMYTFLMNGIMYFRETNLLLVQPSVFNQLFPFRLISYISQDLLITASIFSVFFASLLMNNYIKKFAFFSSGNMLPAYIFVTLTGFTPFAFLLSSHIVALWAMLFIVFELLKIFDEEIVAQRLFFLAMLMALAGMMYMPLGYYLAFLIIALPVIKKPKFREILIIIIGWLVPVYLLGFYFYYKFGVEYILSFFSGLILLPDISFQISFNISWIGIIYLFSLIIFAYFNFRFESANLLVRHIRYYNTLFVYFLVSVFIILFVPSNGYASGVFFIIPVTVYLSNFFNNNSFSRAKNIIFIALLVVIAMAQWVYYKS